MPIVLECARLTSQWIRRDMQLQPSASIRPQWGFPRLLDVDRCGPQQYNRPFALPQDLTRRAPEDRTLRSAAAVSSRDHERGFFLCIGFGDPTCGQGDAVSVTGDNFGCCAAGCCGGLTDLTLARAAERIEHDEGTSVGDSTEAEPPTAPV